MIINPCVIGLGYVGLPLTLEIAKKYKDLILPLANILKEN